MLVSPTLVVTCAHVAGARFSDPKHDLTHFRIRDATGNGVPLTPGVWVGTDEPPHFDIAFLRAATPLHEEWSSITSARTQLYRAPPSLIAHILSVVCVFCEQALRERRRIFSLASQDCRIQSPWLCRKRTLWRAWNEWECHPG